MSQGFIQNILLIIFKKSRNLGQFKLVASFSFVLRSFYFFRFHNYIIVIYSIQRTTLDDEYCLFKEHWIFKLGKNNFESLKPMDPFQSRNPL
jgi:hypothetical protein